MRAIGTLMLSLLVCCLFALSPARAQIAVGISVDVAPPPLPVYDQPPIPEPGYMWTPGYWVTDGPQHRRRVFLFGLKDGLRLNGEIQETTRF